MVFLHPTKIYSQYFSEEPLLLNPKCHKQILFRNLAPIAVNIVSVMFYSQEQVKVC